MFYTMPAHKSNFEKWWEMFKKYSKFQKFIEMLCCGMTRLRNIIKLGVFRQFQNSKTILKTKTIGHKRFKKLLKFLKFQLSNLLWLGRTRGKWIVYGLIWLTQKKLQQKMKMLDKIILKSIWIKQFQWNTVSRLYLGAEIIFWWVLRGVSPRKKS